MPPPPTPPPPPPPTPEAPVRARTSGAGEGVGAKKPNTSGAKRDTWTIQRLLAWTTKHFEQKQIDAPRLTGELLLGHALALSRVQLYMDLARPLQADELARFRALVQLRDSRVPTQHLLGTHEFYGRKFKVDRRALIPRPETELLVEACVKLAPAQILELGPGTGVIVLSLLAELPEARAIAIELSTEAASLCRENAAVLGLDARLELREGDLFAPLEPDERFDLIVSNPPYVATSVLTTLEPEVRDHDPKLALDGGDDGLAVTKRLVAEAPRWLAPGGTLALEIGDDQGPAVAALLTAAGFANVTVSKDYAELDRIAIGRLG